MGPRAFYGWARAQWPMMLVLWTLPYVIWPCPMSYGLALCPVALSYVLWICPKS